MPEPNKSLEITIGQRGQEVHVPHASCSFISLAHEKWIFGILPDGEASSEVIDCISNPGGTLVLPVSFTLS